MAGNLYAQFFNPKCRYTSFGASLKATYFHGDVLADLQCVRPGFGLHLNRRLSPRFSFMSELAWVRIMGDDYTSSNLLAPAKINTYIRNLSFRNDIKQLSAIFKYDIFPNMNHYRKRPEYNLYLFSGLTGFYHNPKAKDNKGKWTSLRPLHTEGVKYSAWQIAIPVGIGVRYKLSIQWDLEVDLTYMITFTDYLDDVSKNYPDPSTLSSDKARMFSNRTADSTDALTGSSRDLAYIQADLNSPIVGSANNKYVQGYGPGSKRGTMKGFDSYAYISIRVSYAIPGFVNCPKFREIRQ
ncbi:MAG TPA: DUF6089 family protein [Cytophagaceae bacterium]|nr:DUF6089 family protein [Cytophagaceae bacterium]